MKKMFALLILTTFILPSVTGFAASPWTEKPTYNSQVAGKLQLGFVNTLFGWMDLFIEPSRAARHCTEGQNFVGGIGKGIMDAIFNEVGGVFQLATFPLIADVPLPDDGVHLTKWGQDCCKAG